MGLEPLGTTVLGGEDDAGAPPSLGVRSGVLVGVAFVAALVGAAVTSSGVLVAMALAIPVVLVGWGYGLRGALLAAGAATVLCSPVTGRLFGTGGDSWVAYLAFLFLTIGIAAGALGDRIRERDRRFGLQVERVAGMYDGILSGLASTVESRDQHTQGHCERVATNALVVGRALGFGDGDLDVLHWGALLHDLGKIAVPESVLLKQGALTEEEYLEIQRHPTYGADLLGSLASEFADIADIVRSHHERWDGQGYPRALKGDEIPLMARIVSIVDVFEALTSIRPYRSPMPPGQAMRYIRAGSGSQFDPDLVPVFEELYRRGAIRYSGRRDPEAPPIFGYDGSGASLTAAVVPT